MKKCKSCKNQHTQTSDYCSRSCANRRTHSIETKLKIGNALRGRHITGHKHSTETKLKIGLAGLGRKISSETLAKMKETLTPIRQSAEYRAKLSASLKGRTGGYRTKSGTSKHHGSYYRGVWMDSSWELEFAKTLDKLSMTWVRDSSIVFTFVLDDRIVKYHPDFYIPSKNMYIEIKGYWTVKSKHKFDTFKLAHQDVNIVLLDSLEKIKTFA